MTTGCGGAGIGCATGLLTGGALTGGKALFRGIGAGAVAHPASNSKGKMTIGKRFLGEAMGMTNIWQCSYELQPNDEMAFGNLCDERFALRGRTSLFA